MRAATKPLDAAFTAMRQGVGSEWQWAVVCSAINLAVAIEKRSGIKGVQGHLHNAELALQAISQRAMANGHWQATAVYDAEIEAIDTAIDLHKLQIKKLSAGQAGMTLSHAQTAPPNLCSQQMHAPALPQTAALFA